MLRLVGKHRCIPNQSTLKTKDMLEAGLKGGIGAVLVNWGRIGPLVWTLLQAWVHTSRAVVARISVKIE